jgi:hypothetical protein
MTFTKANTVGQMILNAAAKLGGKPASVLRWNTGLSE